MGRLGCAPALRRELFTSINWGHTSDSLAIPQIEVCPLTIFTSFVKETKNACNSLKIEVPLSFLNHF